jgi:hypothetical protein
MANEKINQEVLDQLLVDVTSEISDYLRKDEAELRKAATPDEESEGSSGPTSPEASSDEGSAPAAAPEASEPGAPAPDASAPAPEASAPAGAMAPDAAAIEPAPSVEGLQAEYMKLDPEALKMHYMACKQALMTQMGAAPEATPPMAPEASAPPAPPPMSPEASAPAMKAEAVPSAKEMPHSEEANGGEIEKGKALGKSEAVAEIQTLKAQLAKSEADRAKTEEMILDLTMKLTAPLRKSIKGISEIDFISKEGGDDKNKKSPAAGLSKQEVVAKLREKARNESLKKSDRELINQYTFDLVDVSKIEHLLVG